MQGGRGGKGKDGIRSAIVFMALYVPCPLLFRRES